MNGRRFSLCLLAFSVMTVTAQAQGFYVPSGYVGFPYVAGPVYTPVPLGVQYMPAYRYVTPAVSTYGVPAVAPVTSTTQVEVAPTPAGSTTTSSTTTSSTTVTSPAPVTSTYVTQTSYYTPAVVSPVVVPVRTILPRKVKFYPRRGIVRVRY